MTPGRVKDGRAGAVLSWLAPLVLSAVVAFGSVQFTQGTAAQKLATVERDVSTLERKLEASNAEHANFPSREEFKLMLDDLKEIKADVREIRRSLTK